MKITNILLVLLLTAGSVFAQNETRPTQRGNLNASSASCTPSNAASTVALTVGPNDSGATIQIGTGTFSATVSFAVTADGTNWVSTTGSPVVAGAGVTSATSAGAWQVNVTGMSGVCAFVSTFVSGLVPVTVKSSQGTPDDSSISITGGSISITGGPVTVATNSLGATAIVAADTSANIAISTATTTQVVALASGKSVRVTGIGLAVSATAATADNITFVTGTGSNCATGQAVIFGPLTGGAQVTAVGFNTPEIFNYGGGLGQIFQTPASQALCITTTGTQPIGGIISFAQFFYLPPTDEHAAEEVAVWRGGRMPRRNTARRPYQ